MAPVCAMAYRLRLVFGIQFPEVLARLRPASKLTFRPRLFLTQENLMTHIPQSEQSMRSEQSMHGMQHSMQSCIQACMECHQVCLQTAMNHCLEMGGKHVEPEHFRLMMCCAEICQTSANFMLSNSTFHNRLCGVCAEVCDACGQDCKSIGDMDECVEACMNCAESCRQMAGSSMQH
jgi:hypothetical protein